MGCYSHGDGRGTGLGRRLGRPVRCHRRVREYDGRVVTVGVVMLVGDVGEEDVNCVEGLSVCLTHSLRGC